VREKSWRSIKKVQNNGGGKERGNGGLIHMQYIMEGNQGKRRKGHPGRET